MSPVQGQMLLYDPVIQEQQIIDNKNMSHIKHYQISIIIFYTTQLIIMMKDISILIGFGEINNENHECETYFK